MPLSLPPLASLRVFEAAARLGSFRKAAEELNLTPSAVSHGVDALEGWIGAALFERHGRSVRLTPAGEDFLPYVGQGLSTIAMGARRVSPHLGSPCVAFSSAPTFASHWLVPRLMRFQAAYPTIGLRIDTSHRQVLFPLEGVDVAVRMGAGPPPDTSSTLLFRESLIALAAPAVAEHLCGDDGQPDWRRAVLIHLTTVDHDWRTWTERTGTELQPKGHLYFDTARLGLDAAAAGAGVVLGRLPLCQSEIAGGRLVPLGDPVPIETGHWLTTPVGREPRREVLFFCRWLLREAGVVTDERHSPQ